MLIATTALMLLAIYRINIAFDERARQAAAARVAEDHRAAQAQLRETAQCRLDARCWGQRHSANATIACSRSVDLAAKYATRWPSGLFNPAFLNWAWRDQNAGTLVYVGRVELQNGFGAWAPYIVGCLFDTTSGTVTGLELQPGRL